MADDARTLELLGEIRGGQNAINRELATIRGRVDDLAGTASRIETETTRGFGETSESIARVEEQLEAHIREDDRRFVEVKEDTTRAHRKIGSLAGAPAGGGGGMTSYGENGQPIGMVRDEMTPAKKGGIIGGILAGLSAAGYWLASHMSGSGGGQ